MYLAELEIKNFRCFREITLNLQPGLNVIVGENNTGKTAILDAIRILLGQGKYRYDVSEDDFNHDASGVRTGNICEIHATFKELSVEEQGGFSICLSPSLGHDVAQLHIRYEIITKGTHTRMKRPIMWGGEREGESIPYDILDGISLVYLEALRNAQIGLTPGRGNRISRLVQQLVKVEDDRNRLTKIIADANQRIEKDNLIERSKAMINARLKGITGEVMAQTADLRLTSPEFRRITESLRALIGSGQAFEVEENGLGYNNLLYIATVLGELQKAKADEDIDLAVLLIEEPEAHLHPHLQTVLIDYLQNIPLFPQNDDAAADRAESPVQVFVTSHSPIVASRVNLDVLNILHLSNKTTLVSLPVKECLLGDRDWKYLQRYLDVTKAQLFFAKGVIFVEGISEALLLPEFAIIMNCDLSKYAISVINVQSLAFQPFARLFQKDKLQLRAAILTDSDPRGDDPTSDAAQSIRELETGSLKVFMATKTFEYDLALAADANATLMGSVYRQLRPRKGKALADAVQAATSNTEKAEKFMENFDSIDKARFAQQLAASIAKSSAGFAVPQYIQNAINHVIGAQGSGKV
jgi:putative ATP-dependent endonuclease of OLD family